VKPRTVVELAAQVAGEIRAPAGTHARVCGIAADSRLVRPGDAFVAVSAREFDSHPYVADAARRGAVCAVVESGARVHGDLPSGFPLIEVPEPLAALAALATRERGALSATVVAITGSTGKTCTKDFTAAALGARLRVAASPESFNNEIGLPLTILSVPDDAEAVVCEMGARGIGHIRALCDVARPHVGIVTNVGPAHLELFGSLENVVTAKGELVEALPPAGTAILNGDDPVVSAFDRRTRAGVLRFGTAASADVRAEAVAVDSAGRPSFSMRTPWGSAEVRLAVPGEQMVPDALAAAAAAGVLGIDPADSAEALGSATVSGGRMEVFRTGEGVTIVNDAYNANPTSTAAALRAARTMAGDGRLLALLGEMAELGAFAADEHDRIGAMLARLGVDELIVVGPWGKAMADAAERGGLAPERVHASADPDEAERTARSLMRPGDLVLVKASRVVGLRRVAESLRGPAGVAEVSGP
jgi:UDP-N-acetylmuramoyl-tripeptide--D-alanyl-D-alanine ligase